jgi:hypothetical protein
VPGADGGMAFGTDDENLGAAIYLDWQKREIESRR